MVTLPFAKMHGIGNDFVVVGASDIGDLHPSNVAKIVCERHFGIGADGLLIIGGAKDPAAAFSFRMHNPDGTPDMCGNGLRCAVLYAHRQGLVAKASDTFLVETVDGLLQGHLIDVSESQDAATVRVEMATPRLQARDIPFTGIDLSSEMVDYLIKLGPEELRITAINTGSTHSVTFVDRLPDENLFLTLSPELENHSLFPERTSVMWAEQAGKDIYKIRIWERGAGETLGCGTGACAVAGSAILSGFSEHGSTIHVTSKGGTLAIEWPKRDGPMWLTGPAQWVFGGKINLAGAGSELV